MACAVKIENDIYNKEEKHNGISTIIVCSNVFKNADKAISVEEFNQRWIDLINRYEMNKEQLVSVER